MTCSRAESPIGFYCSARALPWLLTSTLLTASALATGGCADGPMPNASSTGQPDAGSTPDGITMTVLDGLPADQPLFDWTTPDAGGQPDTAGPDAGTPDARNPDTGQPDRGGHDDTGDGSCQPELVVASPFAGDTLSASADIVVSVADYRCVDRVELWVDGALYETDTSAPFAFSWDTATAHDNPLPAPNHPIDFGYYFVDYKGADNRHEVNHYTNQYYAWAWRPYVSDADWPPLLTASMQNAVDDGKVIHFNVEDEIYWDDALDVATPYWDEIVRIELIDEPNWNQAETEEVVSRFRAELSSRGLGDRPLGIVYTRDQILQNTSIFANGLDWVGIEAYVDVPESSADSAANVALLNSRIEQLMARVPLDKDIVMVMMAYDRNGGWTNIATLIDMQDPAYLQSYDDPRVVAINMFSYTRLGGSHDHPELRVPHQRMAERIFDMLVPELSNGPHTLEVRAYDAAGSMGTHSIDIRVEN